MRKQFNRKSLRLATWDYSTPWWYFVTICTCGHKNYFGEIKNGKVILNELGEIVKSNWQKIDSLHEHVENDYFIIMPNHIHGIIIINENVRDANFASRTNNDRTKMELSKIIQQFKRACTIQIKTDFPDRNFKWHRSFYDRIIRNESELYKIRKYIELNPIKEEINNIP